MCPTVLECVGVNRRSMVCLGLRERTLIEGTPRRPDPGAWRKKSDEQVRVWVHYSQPGGKAETKR